MKTTYGGRLLLALTEKKTTRRALAERLGVSVTAVGLVVNGQSRAFDARNHSVACEMLGLNPIWLATGVGPMWRDPPSDAGSVSSSPAVVHTVPPLVSWVDLMNTKADDLPEEFRIEAPDSALSPRLEAGQLVTLDRRLTPRRGDAVLVEDTAGGRHLRLYRPTIGGAWQAAALDADFPPMLSDRDGLTVLAVLTAVASRWG